MPEVVLDFLDGHARGEELGRDEPAEHVGRDMEAELRRQLAADLANPRVRPARSIPAREEKVPGQFALPSGEAAFAHIFPERLSRVGPERVAAGLPASLGSNDAQDRHVLVEGAQAQAKQFHRPSPGVIGEEEKGVVAPPQQVARAFRMRFQTLEEGADLFDLQPGLVEYGFDALPYPADRIRRDEAAVGEHLEVRD
jgi:hypothetical protein